MRKILLASVTNKTPEILRPHLDAISRLRIPSDVSLDLAYVVDGLSEEAEELLISRGARVAEALAKPSDAAYAVSEETHHWSLPIFGWLAREKQRLLDLAASENYDGVFFVDSDLVLGPETLASLLSTSKDVVSAVFWTRWTKNAPPLPQVWMRHPYEFDGRGLTSEEFLKALESRALLRVGGLGACTLISSRVFDKVRWFPLLDGLPSDGMWQGEDRHFCVGAERAHVELWADAWPDIYHIYRPSDLEGIHDVLEGRATFPERPKIGDWVSFTLQALEEPELSKRTEFVRGRLGALPALGEIESALSEMNVGDTRVIEVEFPPSWSIASYRGRRKNLLVSLVDAKGYE